MDGPVRTTYRQAALVAAVWLLMTVLLAAGSAWLLDRYDPVGQWNRGGVERWRWTVLVTLALVPFLAGSVHRSVRVLSLTALFEAIMLGALMLLLIH